MEGPTAEERIGSAEIAGESAIVVRVVLNRLVGPRRAARADPLVEE
jgi:hypothetical protein